MLTALSEHRAHSDRKGAQVEMRRKMWLSDSGLYHRIVAVVIKTSHFYYSDGSAAGLEPCVFGSGRGHHREDTAPHR